MREGDLHGDEALGFRQAGGDNQADKGAGGDEKAGMEGVGNQIYCQRQQSISLASPPK